MQSHKMESHEGLIVLSWKLPFPPPGLGGGQVYPPEITNHMDKVCATVVLRTLDSRSGR